MNELYTILRYTASGQPQCLFPAGGMDDEPLLAFIQTHMQRIQPDHRLFNRHYAQGERLFSIWFIPGAPAETPAEVLVVAEVTEKIEVSAEDLASLAGSLRVFFRKAVHDIKNLFANVSILLRDNMVAEAQQYTTALQNHYMQQMEQLGQAMDSLTSIGKPQAPQIKRLVFQSLTDELIAPYQHLLGKNISVETDFQACPAIVYREDYLQNMIRSLLDNAIRYRSEDRALRVSIQTEKTEKGILFSIKDNGIGVDTEGYKSKLFEPFQRFTRQSSGQGISLHLIKLMVEKNGGTIHLESTPKQGTHVTITLQEY